MLELKDGAVLCRVGRNQVYNIILICQLFSNIEKENDFCFRVIPYLKGIFSTELCVSDSVFSSGLIRGVTHQQPSAVNSWMLSRPVKSKYWVFFRNVVNLNTLRTRELVNLPKFLTAAWEQLTLIIV